MKPSTPALLMVAAVATVGPLPVPAAAAATPTPAAAAPAPFAFADFSWTPGGGGAAERPLAAGPLTGELRVDSAYHHSLANPVDDTISGSSEVFRHGELQLTHVGLGGDFAWHNVQARVLAQLGLYAQTTPRNDPSSSRGQWQLDRAYRYLSEAYAGYHLDVLAGINVQAGIFMSYIGLWSYYNFDNWTYQPSYVSSNTPWFFNGARVQIFVNDRLKIEPWLVNGWQAYGRLANTPGVGLQVAWRPTGALALVGNQYVGSDTPGKPGRRRLHTDDSVMVKYFERTGAAVSRAAVSVTLDAGCESGDGVQCSQQYFLGGMAYHRLWLAGDRVGLTLGGGGIVNPGRYLVLLPPINGATAASGTPYFSAAPGDGFWAWDAQATADFMPQPFVTLRAEYTHRAASVPYFAGHGGVTPPGGNQGAAGSAVGDWAPDLAPQEDRFTLALMVKL